MKNILSWIHGQRIILCLVFVCGLGMLTGCSASTAPAAAPVWQPVPGTSWQIQFTGTLDTSLKVDAFELDLFDTPQEDIDRLHNQGVKVICYFSAGTLENWRPDAMDFPQSVLGLSLIGWAGESWLDIRQIEVVLPLMSARLNLASKKHCDAVDADNIDGYANVSGFSISYADQIAYDQVLADAAHQLGMSMGLKNNLGQVNDLADRFDFATNESCIAYNECDVLKTFISRNHAVFGIEYSGTLASVCQTAISLKFDTVFKNKNLDGYRISCR